jgi:hypothetical protein
VARIARIARRHPDQALALLGVAAAACGLYAAAGQDRLAIGGGPNGASRLLVRVQGPGKVGSPTFRIPLSVMTTALRSDTAVARVTRVVSADGRSATLVVHLSGSPAERSAAVGRIESGLDPGPLTITFSGEAGNATSDRDQALGDLPLLLLAALPAAALGIFLLGAGPALAALFCLAATVFAAAAVCVALADALDLTVLALVGAACAGVPAALLASGVVARRSSWRRLTVVAVAGALAFAAVAAIGAGGSRSLALSGGIAWLIAAPVGLLGMTAAGELWDGRTPPALWRGQPPSRVGLAARALLAIVMAALIAGAALGLCHLAFSGPIPKLTGLAVVAAVGACSLAASASGDRRAAILAEGITALAAASLLLAGLREMQIVAFGIAAGLLADILVVRLLGQPVVARVRAR